MKWDLNLDEIGIELLTADNRRVFNWIKKGDPPDKISLIQPMATARCYPAGRRAVHVGLCFPAAYPIQKSDTRKAVIQTPADGKPNHRGGH
jgi:hypothetical protein